MDAVYTDVKLTAGDEIVRTGSKGSRKTRHYEAKALVDTGALCSVAPNHVVSKLGLKARGERVAEYADGRKEIVGLTAPILFEIQGRDTIEEALILGDEALIGQTVLEKLDLLADCTNQKLIPNPTHPDQPVIKVKRVAVKAGSEPPACPYC